MPRFILRLASAALLASAPAAAQFGNGCVGDLETTPMTSGSNFTMTVKGAPLANFAVFISDLPGPTAYPGFGVISLDIFSPFFALLTDGFLSPTGTASLTTFIPNDPIWNSIVIYGQGIVADAACPPIGYAITRGLRFDFEPPDTFTAMPPMAAPRALGTGDLLTDGRVFVAGGGNGTLTGPAGTGSTEIYDPFSRSWSLGPTMSVNRAFHQSARLNDGRVLLIGGTDSAGVVSTSCEVFNPSTGTITTVASMGTPRAGATATLLGNGKVLVTGGVTTFQIPAGTTSIAPILATCLNTGEVYDPVANTWTAVPGTMAGKRFVHTATLLQSGKVLIVSGIDGSSSLLGQDIPTFTATCSLYNPTTNAWEAAAALPSGLFSTTPARAGHRATLMNNGEVFVGGGLAGGLFGPGSTNTSAKYSLAGAWSSAGTSPASMALHGQVLLKNGKCHISGGGSGSLISFTSTAVCATRNAGAAAYTTTASLPAPRGTHLAVRLLDGSVLIIGGGDAAGVAVDSVELYSPAP